MKTVGENLVNDSPDQPGRDSKTRLIDGNLERGGMMGVARLVMGIMVADPAAAIAIEVTRVIDAVLTALDFKPVEKQARLRWQGDRSCIIHGHVFFG